MMSTPSSSRLTVAHHAMATEFSITIVCHDARYARQAAAEAFAQLERLEDCLSAYRPASDLSRIARLNAGQSCVVHPDTRDCLQIGLDMECTTGGAFDMAYRARPRRAASQWLRLADRRPVVTALGPRPALDLGGLGKGFALDRMAGVLADWDLPCALLRASRSTFLACQAPPGRPGWQVRFGPPGRTRSAILASCALSGSGSDVKGPHIIDPRTGRPAWHHRLAFATAATGAEADALSTALVVMTGDCIREFCADHPHHGAYVVRAGEDALELMSHPHGGPMSLFVPEDI